MDVASARLAVDVVPFRDEHLADCEAILAALPDWFGIPESNRGFIRGLSELPAFVALQDGAVVGFASLRLHTERSAELEVLAVRPEIHRRGAGSALVASCEAWLRRRGVTLLHVKTLAPSHPDPFYARTRAFYLAHDFQPLFESDAFSGAENPLLVLVKSL